MEVMFAGASAFNQPIHTIGQAWNTSKVSSMFGMFYNASAFNQPIGTWNTSKVTNMTQMFYNASAFNQDISSWQVYKLTSKPNKPQGFDSGITALLASHLPDWAMSEPVV
jgi:surface protein